MKNRMRGSRLLAVLLMLCLLLAACEKPVDPTTDPTTVPSQPTKPAEITYTVNVSADNGKKLSGVGVWIYTDSSMTEMIWFDKTNDEGTMSFVAKESGQYVLALQDVPEGYEVAESYPVSQQTDIVLKTVIVQGGEIGKEDLKLGDVMVDFSVTTVDGATLNFADMLSSKKAIVLNFFYNECAPCKMEFPLLQQAYAQYASDVVVVAMNPINTDENAVKALAADLGLKFPMALCEYGWETAFDLQAYPTTVVIDRYGIISMIHKGSITEAGVFEDVFAFFTAEDYTQTVVTDINDIAGKPVEGTKENPIVLGSIQGFDGNVEAGSALYYQIYKISGMILEIRNENLWVEYEGEKVYPENGVISLKVSSPDVSTPVELVIGNAGNKAEVFHATLTYPLGTGGNPIVLTPGFFTTQVEKGNDQGVWYTYVVESTGALRLSCLGATEGVNIMYSVYNTSTGSYYSVSHEGPQPDMDSRFITLNVTAGDVLQITVGTLPDEEYNYPAAQIEMALLYTEEPVDPPVGPVDPTDPTDPPEPPQVNVYTVVVVDDRDNPVPGVEVLFSAFDDMAIKLTDADGLAQFADVSLEVGFQITVPAGYEAPEMVYPVLTPDRPVFLVTLQVLDTPVEPPVEPTEPPVEPTEPPVEPTEPPVEPPVDEPKYTELYVGKAYHVYAGENEWDILAGDVNYFLFHPETAGVYRISTSRPEAILSYWGGNIHFITEQTSSTDYADNAFTINVKESMLGQGHIIGITGAGSCVLKVERISDPILYETDAPWDIYAPQIPITDVTVEKPADKALTYVDVAGKTENYTLCYNDQTGFYHLGSLEGPVVYVNVKSAPYLSLNGLIQNTGLHVYHYDSNGEFINKVDFTPVVADYVAHADKSKGLYPLNDDLMHILKECGGYYGWWDETSPNYLLLGSGTPNPEIAWMFICCYYE